MVVQTNTAFFHEFAFGAPMFPCLFHLSPSSGRTAMFSLYPFFDVGCDILARAQTLARKSGSRRGTLALILVF